MKMKMILSVAAAVLTAASTFASDKACCATTASTKQGCEATFANLSLNAEQKTKMEKLATDCDKGGCSKESMAKMEKSAEGILSKDQFVAWKAACSGKMGEKTRS